MLMAYNKLIYIVGNNIICNYIVIYCRGISIVRSLKLFTLPHPFSQKESINIIVLTSKDWLTTILAYLNRYP